MAEKAGRRVYPEGGQLKFAPGDYGRDGLGCWWARPPAGHLGSLANHEVTEHEDGTITVTPSIEGEGFHGTLERGLWKW